MLSLRHTSLGGLGILKMEKFGGPYAFDGRGLLVDFAGEAFGWDGKPMQ
jgi:hypothetical protein